MEKMYVDFVEELRRELLDATGYDEERIYYKDKEEYPPTSGDRLILKHSESSNGTAEVCALYIKDLYEAYRNGRSLGDIVEAVMKRMRELSESDILQKVKDLEDYDRIKGDLFIRLINRESHEVELENAVFRVLGDIALVLYVRMGEMDGSVTSMKVKNYMVEEWGLDKTEVFDKALLNTYFISPPRIYCWEKLIYHPTYEGDNFMNLLSDYPIRTDSLGNCLSTTKRTNGAVAIFLPGVAERISDLMDDDFYIVFTSVHEAMVHCMSSVDPEDLQQVLEDTVRETTPPEDFLTLKIYQYNRAAREFMPV